MCTYSYIFQNICIYFITRIWWIWFEYFRKFLRLFNIDKLYHQIVNIFEKITWKYESQILVRDFPAVYTPMGNFSNYQRKILFRCCANPIFRLLKMQLTYIFESNCSTTLLFEREFFPTSTIICRGIWVDVINKMLTKLNDYANN